MTIDQKLAESLGFPRPKYTAVERERRWLCSAVPDVKRIQVLDVTDVYVTGTRLRLRAAAPLEGGPTLCRLTRKADVDARTRLLTSIYLPEAEFAILVRIMKGPTIKKRRYRLAAPPGVSMGVDMFEGDLSGLVMAEAEFETEELMNAFPMPDFSIREITNDLRYNGFHLATNGLPKD